MARKATLITNSIIAGVLLTLSFFVFNLNLSNTYLGITAPLYNGNRDSGSIAIMFVVDDQETAANLPHIADTLINAKASATFFLSGIFVANNLELTKNLAENFELGNYGFSNIRLDTTDKSKIQKEITFCNDLIMSVTKKAPTVFTPPKMLYNKNTLAIAKELGYKTVMPTTRPAVIDWATTDTNLVVSYATHGVRSGDIILLRPTTATTQCLSRIVATLLEKNLTLQSVEGLFAPSRQS